MVFLSELIIMTIILFLSNCTILISVCDGILQELFLMMSKITAYPDVATYALSSACLLVLPAAIVAIYHGGLAIKLYTVYDVVGISPFQPLIATENSKG